MQTRSARNSGFTLVEMMTVVAIIGLLAGLAVVFIDKGQKGKEVQGFAERLGAQYEMARARAVSTQKRQRIVIEADRFTHWQSIQTGLSLSADPFNYTTDWVAVSEAQAPRGVTVGRPGGDADKMLHFEAGEGVSAAVMSFPIQIDVLPDGRSRTAGSVAFFESGWTIWIGNAKSEVRVLLLAVTGTSLVYDKW